MNDQIESAYPSLPFSGWRVTDLVGEGSFGTVYRAESSFAPFVAAIKHVEIPRRSTEIEQLRCDGLADEGIRRYYEALRDRFSSEIVAMERMKDCKNVVRIYDHFASARPGGVGFDLFIMMEYLTPLSATLAFGGLSEESVVRLGADVAEALDVCSREGYIHRDVKPENIFVDKEGNYKLGDFGIARVTDEYSASFSRIGTQNYMAPEVASGQKYDGRADIYSLGLTLYRLANHGRMPFLDTEAQLIDPAARSEATERRLAGEKLPPPGAVGDRVAKVILKACEFDPADRYKNASALRKALLGEENSRVPSALIPIALIGLIAAAAVAATAVGFAWSARPVPLDFSERLSYSAAGGGPALLPAPLRDENESGPTEENEGGENESETAPASSDETAPDEETEGALPIFEDRKTSRPSGIKLPGGSSDPYPNDLFPANTTERTDAQPSSSPDDRTDSPSTGRNAGERTDAQPSSPSDDRTDPPSTAGGTEERTASPSTSAPSTKPARTEPAQTEPAQTKPAQTEPAQTKPAQTEPAQTKPAQTKPAQTEPAATEPDETEPDETEPEETDPEETEPVGWIPATPVYSSSLRYYTFPGGNMSIDERNRHNDEYRISRGEPLGRPDRDIREDYVAPPSDALVIPTPGQTVCDGVSAVLKSGVADFSGVVLGNQQLARVRSVWIPSSVRCNIDGVFNQYSYVSTSKPLALDDVYYDGSYARFSMIPRAGLFFSESSYTLHTAAVRGETVREIHQIISNYPDYAQVEKDQMTGEWLVPEEYERPLADISAYENDPVNYAKFDGYRAVRKYLTVGEDIPERWIGINFRKPVVVNALGVYWSYRTEWSVLQANGMDPDAVPRGELAETKWTLEYSPDGVKWIDAGAAYFDFPGEYRQDGTEQRRFSFPAVVAKALRIRFTGMYPDRNYAILQISAYNAYYFERLGEGGDIDDYFFAK